MLKQGASSHNLALRETRRQREKVPLSKGPVDLSSFKDEDEKEEGSAEEGKAHRFVRFVTNTPTLQFSK